MLASHDDGECHFRFRDRAQMVAVLQKAVPVAYSGRVVNAIVTVARCVGSGADEERAAVADVAASSVSG